MMSAISVSAWCQTLLVHLGAIVLAVDPLCRNLRTMLVNNGHGGLHHLFSAVQCEFGREARQPLRMMGSANLRCGGTIAG
jgi:hypothetical protein